ncbi:hypothetical protein [Aureimonas ureilytica]|uniref:hypothetical protein n=1 Tax=Aureimonas ureilytica TaxID=401562 RepID=UPI00036E8F11|nr:hypothetical protein [Aureimonas ureilytica]
MALVKADRVKELTLTTGTGSLALGGAVQGFQSFASGVGVGNTCDYAINGPGGTWEVGLGTLSAAGTLQRTTVYASSSGTSAVDLPAGNKEVFLTAPARSLLDRRGDQMTGPLTSAVKDHGTLGAVTEAYSYADANVHTVTINGAHTINPTNLVEGGVMQINILYQSGSIAVSGTTQWELGGTKKSTNIADVGATLVAGNAYRLALTLVRGVRAGVLQ